MIFQNLPDPIPRLSCYRICIIHIFKNFHWKLMFLLMLGNFKSSFKSKIIFILATIDSNTNNFKKKKMSAHVFSIFLVGKWLQVFYHNIKPLVVLHSDNCEFFPSPKVSPIIYPVHHSPATITNHQSPAGITNHQLQSPISFCF